MPDPEMQATGGVPLVDAPVEAFTESDEWLVFSLGAELPVIEAGPEKLTVKTIATLGVVSCVAYVAERKGLLVDLNPGARTVIQSCSHPVLGYLGALFGTRLAEGQPKSRRILAATLGALAVNFGTESAQEVLSSKGAFDYWQHSFETVKDALFASAGAGLFFWQKSKAKSQQNVA